MKTSPYRLLVIIGLLLSSYYSLASIEPVRVTIQAQYLKGHPVKASIPNLFTFEPIELAEASINSAGKATLDIPVAKTTFVYLRIGETAYTLLLSPGDNLQVDLTGKSATASFTGKAAKAATYLQKASTIWHQYEQRGGTHFLQLAPDAFSSRADSLTNTYARFDQQSTALASLPQSVRHLLQERNRLQLLGIKLNYALMLYKPNDPTKAGPLTITNVMQEVPFDAALLESNLYEYGFVLAYWTQAGQNISTVVSKSRQEETTGRQQLPLIADQQLVSGDYPAAVRAFLRAKNLYTWFGTWGITPANESILNDIIHKPDYAAYKAILSQKHTKLSALAAGRPAPDFSGITPAGSTLSVSSLIGKVVYVDVWATWCIPCREEFPKAIKLQSQFAGNDQVAFLYVSIDRNQDAWKKLLGNETTPKGIHVNQPPGKLSDQFSDAYQIGEIPRYILIDQHGKLVNANAAHPSSAEIESVIRGLLP